MGVGGDGARELLSTRPLGLSAKGACLLRLHPRDSVGEKLAACLPELDSSQAGPLVVVDRGAGERRLLNCAKARASRPLSELSTLSKRRAIIGRTECSLLGRPTVSGMGTDADQGGASF